VYSRHLCPGDIPDVKVSADMLKLAKAKPPTSILQNSLTTMTKRSLRCSSRMPSIRVAASCTISGYRFAQSAPLSV